MRFPTHCWVLLAALGLAASQARGQFALGGFSGDTPWTRSAVVAPPVRCGQSGSIGGASLRRLPEVAPASHDEPLSPPADAPTLTVPPQDVRPPGERERLRPEFTGPPLETIAPSEVTSTPSGPTRESATGPFLGFLPRKHTADWFPPIVPPGAVGLNYQRLAGTAPVGATWFEAPWMRVDGFHLDFLGRAAFENDQRIEWSGVEATFGAEGALLAGAREDLGMFTTGIETELLINQPFDRNILADTAERRSYLANWDIDPFRISQLYLFARRNDFLAAIGKMMTPFGRVYFPLYKNDRSDAPFIRTESILWRETGMLFQWDPGPWVFTCMLNNGGPDRDSNSSKGVVARIGYDSQWMAFGGSVKRQDGIGSEHQKTYNDHVGLDGMLRRGPWTLSGEVIYDVYGFRQPFNPLNITWGRSIYYRDQNVGLFQPITGLGYYGNLGYSQGHWTTMLNFGQFFPKQIGDPRHDIPNWRAIAKVIWHYRSTDSYLMAVWENDVPNAQDGRHRQGADVLAGFQIAL